MKQIIYLLVVFTIALSLSSCRLSDVFKANQYAVAYTINDKELSDGELIEFETNELLPSVSTILPSNISDSSAICGGVFTDNKDAEIISKGICWSTHKNPTLDDNLGFTNEGQGIGSFTSSLNHLDNNTIYYVKAYAINEAGISYGGVHHFTTDF